jgi:hypothetical protein
MNRNLDRIKNHIISTPIVVAVSVGPGTAHASGAKTHRFR